MQIKLTNIDCAEMQSERNFTRKRILKILCKKYEGIKFNIDSPGSLITFKTLITIIVLPLTGFSLTGRGNIGDYKSSQRSQLGPTLLSSLILVSS